MKTIRPGLTARIGRRRFLTTVGTGALALALPKTSLLAQTTSKPEGANSDVRIAIVGIGSADAKGGVGGRGRQLIHALRKVPGTRIVALCDVDSRILEKQARELEDQGQGVKTYGDLRRVLESNDVDAMVVAMPDHWHALATIWACQAGKDVYVEKPISHSIWEGRQMVAASRRYRRIIQCGTQARSSSALREAVEWLQRGELGPIRFGRVIVFRERSGIGKVTEPTPIPPEVNYDLWCGPVENLPLQRSQLHYDWHWRWSTGTGEMGNNGVHYIDLCRWAMKLETAAPRVWSTGGRFGFDDDGETPNTQVALLDYQPAPIYCEIRGLPEKKGSKVTDAFRNTRTGAILECEGGYFSGAHLSGAAFDRQGKKIKEFGPTTWELMDSGHLANFVEAARRRKPDLLNAPILEGHRSAVCCHLANLSQRLGKAAPPGTVRERAQGNSDLTDAIARYHDHLRANEIDLATQEILGPVLNFDPREEIFHGEFAEEANKLLKRAYRDPYRVPSIA